MRVVATIAALVLGPPPLTHADLPSDAQMLKIANAAVAYAKLEQTQIGMAGLTIDVKTCYSGLGAHPSTAKAAYCLVLDIFTSKAAHDGGEDAFAPDYFKDDVRASRVFKLEKRVTTPDNRLDFSQKVDQAELSAENG